MAEVPQNAMNGRAALELAPGIRLEPVLAPQLRECLRVLQMDLPALVEEVRHEAETNPVVEVEGLPDMPPVSEEIRSEAQAEEPPEAVPEDDSNPSVSIDEDAAERRQRFFDRQVVTESLQEHLLAQIGSMGVPEADREFAELIIGDIDDDGRYVGSFPDLVSVTGVSEKRLSDVLSRIQSFDPPGVGGRNLRECLAIQIRQLDVDPAGMRLMLEIVDRHLPTVAKHDLKGLVAATGVSAAACRTAVETIRTLEPKPGRPFLAHGKHPQFIRPELEIEMTADGFTLSSCEHELPVLTIDPDYRKMADSGDTPAETRRYLKERIGSAELLQTAIRRRGETILRVAESVFNEQRDFLSKGFGALHPLTIEQIAERTGFHGTTVGRAVRGKYVRTPRGVFELRRFFCVGRLKKKNDSSDDSAVSATAVKCLLSDLVRGETDKSLTDKCLSEKLSGGGVKISRRTVAKYRAELGIPSAAERMKRRILR